MLVTVYRIVPDGERFQEMRTDDQEFLRTFRFDGGDTEVQWKPPCRIYISDADKPEADFWGCFGNPTIFAVRRELADGVLRSFIDQACEEFPLPLDGRELVLINTVNTRNTLDLKRSQFDPQNPAKILRYVFLDRFGAWLFKTAETCETELLTVEGMAARHDEFKGTVEENGLTGLRFEKLWSSDLPP